MGIRQFGMNFFNNVNCQNVTGRLAGKFISAVRSADGNRQRVQFGFGDKTGGFVRIGYQTFLVQRAFGTVAVFLVGLAGFKRADNTQSPSTEAPTACARATTSLVTRTLYS